MDFANTFFARYFDKIFIVFFILHDFLKLWNIALNLPYLACFFTRSLFARFSKEHTYRAKKKLGCINLLCQSQISLKTLILFFSFRFSFLCPQKKFGVKEFYNLHVIVTYLIYRWRIPKYFAVRSVRGVKSPRVRHYNATVISLTTLFANSQPFASDM